MEHRGWGGHQQAFSGWLLYLKCSFGCCFRCLDSLQKAPGAEGLLCPNCLVVSQKTDLRHVLQLGALVCKVKASSPS